MSIKIKVEDLNKLSWNIDSLFRANNLIIQPHHVVEELESLNTYSKLLDWSYNNELFLDSMPVLKSNDTNIFCSAEINEAVRCFHDILHLTEAKTFSTQDEIWLGNFTGNLANYANWPYVQTKLIRLDTTAQARYYKRYKTFVNDQKQFIVDCFNLGTSHVLDTGKRY